MTDKYDPYCLGPKSKPDTKPIATGGVKAQEYIGGLQYPDIKTKDK